MYALVETIPLMFGQDKTVFAPKQAKGRSQLFRSLPKNLPICNKIQNTSVSLIILFQPCPPL
jgi:hypothetical protein